MSTRLLSIPSATRSPSGSAFVAALNGPGHRVALWAFLGVVLAHWAEHLVQAYQVWVVGMHRPHALGVLGMLWPWLVHSEWLHYGYALVMLTGLILLRPGMQGRARTWWNIALALQFWHHLEHALLLAQAATGWRLGGGTAPSSLVQLVVPRIELHLFYNAVVFAPMVVAMVYHLLPNAQEVAEAKCVCAIRRPVHRARQAA